MNKTKLLLSLTFVSICGYAQGPVTSYYGADNAVYDVVTSSPAINQTAAGANLTWNFNALTSIGESIDTNSTPTAGQLADFPGTTNVVTTTSNVDGIESEFKVYSKHPANVLSLTGIENTGLLLNYSTNNASLGLFPMEYGFSNVDNIGGNYDNGEYAGTFTGTINTNVDAWGTLNLSGNGLTPWSGTVSRLKTLQNISLNYGIFTGIGTVTVTTHSYYVSGDPLNVARFRTTTTVISVPLLSINQTLSQMEVFRNILLGTDTAEMLSNRVQIVPNPVADVLNIASENQKINSVTITDITGKLILKSNSEINTIDVASLQKGVYFATITTDKGSSTQKFVKQ